MMLRKRLALVAVIVLAAVSISAAQDYQYNIQFEYKEHVVQKGDTLWAITRMYLEDSFQWPLVWRENQRINNPDLIYPGQTIRIPIRAIARTPEAVEIEPGQRTEVSLTVEPMPSPAPKVEETPAPATPIDAPAVAPEPVANIPAPPPPPEVKKKLGKLIATRELLLTAGYISKTLPDAGKIAGSLTGRSTFGKFDEILITTARPVEKGQKFYVVNKGETVSHPAYHVSLGWLFTVLGTVEAIEPGKKNVRARVIESFDMMTTQDYLDNYYEVTGAHVEGDPRTPEMEGFIVATRQMRHLNATYDVIFIDKGGNDGLIEGDFFSTLFVGSKSKEQARFQIVNTRHATALGLIKNSRAEIESGDKFTTAAKQK